MGLPWRKTEAAILSGTPAGPAEGWDLSGTPSQALNHSMTPLLPASRGVMCQDPPGPSSNHQGCFLGPLPCLSVPISMVWFLCGTLGGGCGQFVCFFLRRLVELGSCSQHATLGYVQDKGPNQDWESFPSPAVTAELSRWCEEPL